MAEKALSRPEFVALMAMLFATIAFSIDAMLPALPEIAAELTPEAPNRAQLIVTSFVLGMGIGTLFTGPLSDAYGRKRVIVFGSGLYIAGAAIAWAAPTLELAFAGRVLQGLGAAAPRVVALAIIRDLYEGRRMAQLMSFVMLIFTLFPAIAPAIGAGIISLAGWRSIFLTFVLFSLISVLWLVLRQPETLAYENRRPLNARMLVEGLREVLGTREVWIVIFVLSLMFGILFGVLVSTQPVFDQTFGRGASFHWWFALIALIAATGSILNAQVVMRFGMRLVAKTTFAAQIGFAAVMVATALTGAWDDQLVFAIYMIWTASVFFMAGLTIGNLNALAMVPLGHIAGMAASVIGAVSTVLGVMIAVPVGLAFNGTPLPVAIGVLVGSTAAWLLMRQLTDPVGLASQG